MLFQVVSAGQNGAELGNDEEQIVYVLYTILNVEDNKVRDLWGISNFFFWSLVQLEVFIKVTLILGMDTYDM